MQGAGAAHGDAGGARGDRAGAGDRDRAVEPRDLDRADPRASAGSREALRATEAPVVAVSPLVRGAVLKGPTDLFMDWAGHPLIGRRDLRPLRRADRRPRQRRAGERRPDARDRRRDGRRRAPAGAWRARRSSSPPPCAGSIARPCARSPSSPSSPSAAPSSASATPWAPRSAARWRARWPSDVLEALGRVRGARRRDRRVGGGSRARDGAPAGSGPVRARVELVHDPEEAGQSAAARRGDPRGGRAGRASGCCSCRATARRSTRRRSRALLAEPRRRAS